MIWTPSWMNLTGGGGAENGQPAKWRTMLSVVQVEQQWCFHNAEVSQIARSRFENVCTFQHAFSDRSLTEQWLKWRLLTLFTVWACSHIAPWFCLHRLWRYINCLLTYLLTYLLTLSSFHEGNRLMSPQLHTHKQLSGFVPVTQSRYLAQAACSCPLLGALNHFKSMIASCIDRQS